jgi:hypothetical protein
MFVTLNRTLPFLFESNRVICKECQDEVHTPNKLQELPKGTVSPANLEGFGRAWYSISLGNRLSNILEAR